MSTRSLSRVGLTDDLGKALINAVNPRLTLYTRAAFLDLVHRARRIIGDGVALSTDVISGFSSESSEEHDETVRVMREVGFEQAFTFAYSERPGTPAHRRALAGETSFVDDVAAGDKRERRRPIATAAVEAIDVWKKSKKLS